MPLAYVYMLLRVDFHIWGRRNYTKKYFFSFFFSQLPLYIAARLALMSEQPDRPFNNFRAYILGDLRVLCRSKTSSDGFWSSKAMEGSVGKRVSLRAWLDRIFAQRKRNGIYISRCRAQQWKWKRASRTSWPNISMLFDLKVRRLSEFMQFRNIDRRVFRLEKCYVFGRVRRWSRRHRFKIAMIRKSAKRLFASRTVYQPDWEPL